MSSDVYGQLPACIVYKASDIDQLDVLGDDLYARILTRLEFLLNIFLIDRLLTQHNLVSQEDPGLINTSREMLCLTLTFWKHKDRFMGLHSDFEWLVSIGSFINPSCPLSLTASHRSCPTPFLAAEFSVSSSSAKPATLNSTLFVFHGQGSSRASVY